MPKAIKKKVFKKRGVSITELKRLRARACFLRDGQKCLKCGTAGGLSPSHIYPQGRYRNMAWEIDNVKTLCWPCHAFWWHKNPIEANEWIKKTLPASRLSKLKKMSQGYCPKPNLLEVKVEYERLIAQYEKRAG